MWVSRTIPALVMLCVYIIFSLFWGSHWEVLVKYLFVHIMQNPWKIPVKVFIVTKGAGCMPLALLKLTLSQICFK